MTCWQQWANLCLPPPSPFIRSSCMWANWSTTLRLGGGHRFPGQVSNSPAWPTDWATSFCSSSTGPVRSSSGPSHATHQACSCHGGGISPWVHLIYGNTIVLDTCHIQIFLAAQTQPQRRLDKWVHSGLGNSLQIQLPESTSVAWPAMEDTTPINLLFRSYRSYAKWANSKCLKVPPYCLGQRVWLSNQDLPLKVLPHFQGAQPCVCLKNPQGPMHSPDIQCFLLSIP